MSDSRRNGADRAPSRRARFLSLLAVLLVIGWVGWMLVEQVDESEPSAVFIEPGHASDASADVPVLGGVDVDSPEPLIDRHGPVAGPLRLHAWHDDSGSRWPIADATVACDSGGVLGRTDATGRVSIANARARCSGGLVISAAGFLDAEVAPDAVERASTRGTLLEVPLHPLDRIAGRLSWPDGTPALLGGVAVVCWPQGATPRQSSISEALRRATRESVDGSGAAGNLLRVTRTDIDGSFAFPRALPRGSYVVTAGAPGVVSPAGLLVDSRDGYESVVRVWGHYAASVTLLGSDGNPIGVGGASCEPNPILRLPDTIPDGVDFYRAGPVQAALLGIDSRPESDHGEALFCELVSPWSRDEVGPLVMFARSPGHEESRVEFVVPSTATGVGVVTVPLEPDGVALGQVSLHLSGSGAEGAGRRAPSPHRLLLYDEVDSVVQRCHVLEFEPTGVELANVPCGTYSRAELALGSGLATLRGEGADPVVVRSQESTPITFDISTLGQLEIELLDEDGEEFLGAAQIVVDGIDRVAQGWFTFDSAPYVAPGIQPGDYEVTVAYARRPGSMLDGTSSPRVTVSDGAVCSVQLRLVER